MDLKSRLGSAPSNFSATLDAADSDLAQQVVKDSYVFEHLDPGKQIAERDRERRSWTASGHPAWSSAATWRSSGGRCRIEVGGDEFFVDLLLFHIEQVRYVVVELKIGKFRRPTWARSARTSQLVDGKIRKPDLHAKTVGSPALHRAQRRDARVYALASAASPVAVALYEGLSPEERAALPNPGELEAVIEEEIQACAAPAEADAAHSGGRPGQSTVVGP